MKQYVDNLTGIQKRIFVDSLNSLIDDIRNKKGSPKDVSETILLKSIFAMEYCEMHVDRKNYIVRAGIYNPNTIDDLIKMYDTVRGWRAIGILDFCDFINVVYKISEAMFFISHAYGNDSYAKITEQFNTLRSDAMLAAKKVPELKKTLTFYVGSGIIKE